MAASLSTEGMEIRPEHTGDLFRHDNGVAAVESAGGGFFLRVGDDLSAAVLADIVGHVHHLSPVTAAAGLVILLPAAVIVLFAAYFFSLYSGQHPHQEHCRNRDTSFSAGRCRRPVHRHSRGIYNLQHCSFLHLLSGYAIILHFQRLFPRRNRRWEGNSLLFYIFIPESPVVYSGTFIKNMLHTLFREGNYGNAR